MKFIFVIILICLFGCKEKAESTESSVKEDLEFELLNNEINFIQVNPEQLKSEIVVYSDEQREKPLIELILKLQMLVIKNMLFFWTIKKLNHLQVFIKMNLKTS